MAKESNKDIFISYGREPEVIVFVKQLKKDLELKGLSVWLDTDDIQLGKDWRAEITTGVDNCRIFIPVITQKYVTSRYCVSELYEADNDHKFIFPIMFSNVDFSASDSAKGVKFVVSSINWTMCRPGVDDYEQSIEKLVGAIRDKVFGASGSKQTSHNTISEGMEGLSLASSSTTDVASDDTFQLIPKSTRPIKTIMGLKNPNGVAVSHDNKILVTILDRSEVWVFDENYERIGTIGGTGVEPGKFYSPFGITVDHDNNVIVTCGALLCVQKFTIDGKFLKAAGKPGDGEFELKAPNGVAVSKDGKTYVCDLGNNRIQILTNDLEFLGNFTHTDPEYGSGCLNNPNGIAVNSEGNVFVADMLSHCVQVFTPEGKFLTRIGKQGHIGGCLTSPMSICLDDDDNLYVADGLCRISTFSKTGAFVRYFGGNGMELGKFGLIRGMFLDSDKKLYVCEWQTNRIQIFQ